MNAMPSITNIISIIKAAGGTSDATFGSVVKSQQFIGPKGAQVTNTPGKKKSIIHPMGKPRTSKQGPATIKRMINILKFSISS